MHLLQLLTIVAVHSLRLSSSLPPHVLQHARLPCSSLSPGVCSNSRPLSRWCHPTIPFTVTPFFSCPQSFNIDTLLVTDVQAAFRKGRGTRDQIANICWIIKKAREFQKNIYFCCIDYAKAFDCVDHNKLWEILKEMGIPDHLTYLLRNLYAGQEATVRTGHGTTDWFQIEKGVHQSCILSPC